jgi:hypothetical protein
MIEIIKAPKSEHKTEEALRQALATARPEQRIEAIRSIGQEWFIRLADDDDDSDDKPDFLKGKGDDDAEKGEEKPDGDSEDKGEELGESVEDAKQDLVKELNDVIQQATQVLEQMGEKAQEVADDAKEKDDKIKEIHDTVKDHVAPGGEGLPPEGLPPEGMPPADVGPVPGGPPPGGRPAPRGAPRPPAQKKRPIGPPSGVSAFGGRRTEIVTHSGTDENGTRISLLAAANALAEDPDFAGYELVGMTANADGTYSAKLKLQSE